MQFLTGKYRNITLAIGLFLLLDASILGINVYLSYSIAKDAEAIAQASQLQVLSQRLAKSVYALQSALLRGDEVKTPFAELKQTYQDFDDTLVTFKDGMAAVKKVDAAWQPFRNIVSQVVNMPEAANEEWFTENLDETSRYVSANHNTLLHSSSELVDYFEATASAKTSQLRMIEMAGILLAIINFLFILRYCIGELKETDQMVEKAQEQNRRILAFVGEGLFLLDRNLVLSSQYSAYTGKMFASSTVAGTNFLDLLRHKISEDELRTVKRYLSLLMDSKVKEELADDLNPLRQIRLAISESGGKFAQKYLSFHFSRTWDGDEVAEILVTARDVTQQVRLQEEIKQLQSSQGDQLSTLVKILEMDPREYADFVAESLKRLNRINTTLKQKSRKTEHFRAQIDSILMELHKLKGESSMMNMHSITSETHQMEEILVELKQKKVIEGDHFLPVAVKLKNLLKELEQYQQIASMLLRQIRKPADAEDNEIVSRKSMENLIEGIARKRGNKVELVLQQRGINRIPQRMQRPIRDIVVQLIRNSVSHGIEPSSERLSQGKKGEGQVKVVIMADYKELVLSVQDDGKGIDLEAIRRKLSIQNRYSAEQIEQMSENQLVKMIFEPGFSTAESVNEDAGRGVGMSVIRHMIERMNGKIGVISEAGRYCRFTIRFPFEMENTTGKFQAVADEQEDKAINLAKAS